MHLEQEVALPSIFRKIPRCSKHYQKQHQDPRSGAAPNLFACWVPLVLNTCRIGKWANMTVLDWLFQHGRYTNMIWHENIWTYMKRQHIVAHLCTPDLDLLLHNRALDEFWNASTRQIRAAYTTRWVSWSRELESLYHLGARPTETRSMQIISIYAILYLYIPLYNIIYTISYHYIPI